MLKQTARAMIGSITMMPLVALAATAPTPLSINRALAPRPARVRLASDVFVERFESAPGGRMARVLERAEQLHPGDRLIFVVNWTSNETGDFTVMNPLPHTVAFQSSTDANEEVSVDGGRTWGPLPTLLVRDAGGIWRRAAPDDVTHVRWRVPGRRAATGAGQITYRGVVR
ncbi:hypothetical protein Y88_0720 [Novosphingobium nitrogenifigens DSM 19370]|uniref:DUF11 domain-containing protein n=1 Tax=Novosphingobium nitrogenifigens DSM 19370 TaxID=983920 RepID=F1Z9S9_9SPHN|nr:hypothetical protein [Novosphingobium nitrogenifigens]EGD58663.1 hypothetical protein Y88_0720 [Novosphingobium nitrogenifigens DSM 19370]